MVTYHRILHLDLNQGLSRKFRALPRRYSQTYGGGQKTPARVPHSLHLLERFASRKYRLVRARGPLLWLGGRGMKPRQTMRTCEAFHACATS